MGFIADSMLSQIGLGLSIVGLALVVPICFGFRQYMRYLDHLQIFYLFYLGLGQSSTSIFSGYLDESWVLFPRNFYIFCSSNDLVCTLGFPLSFTTCLVGFILMMRIIVAFEKCRKSQIRFEPVYTFFKGFFRWTFLPLFYYSLYFLIESVKGTKNDLIASIVIFCVSLIFPFMQLIAYKCIQTQDVNIWRKWLQFFSYIRLICIACLVACAGALNSTVPYYFVYAVYVLYIIVYAWKNPFVFKVAGRIFFVLGQVCVLCISFFFIFDLTLLSSYHLDLFFISLILLFDVIHYIALTVYYVKYGVPKDNNEKVNPGSSEESREDHKNKSIQLEELQEHDRRKKYRDSSYDQLDQSYAVRSGKQARKRRR